MNMFTPGTEGVVLGLTAEEYKAAPGIGQSMLKKFAAEATPKHFMESLTRPEPTTDAKEFGAVLHAAILTPHLLDASYHLRPPLYPSDKGLKPWHGGAGWCKDWLEEHADRPVMTIEEMARISRITETVLSLPIVGDIIRTGQKEVSFFKRDEETGLLLKCRVDCISTSTDGETFIIDPKKVRRGYATAERFGVQCADLGYDIQCASYLWITGASRFLFIAMEEEAPFEAEMWEMDAADVAEGFSKWRKMLRAYSDAVADGTWPGYDRTIKRLKLPAWARDRERREAEVIYG